MKMTCEICGCDVFVSNVEIPDEIVCVDCLDIPEDDGQPDEYTEWQDYMGGDDWDHGQYDNGDW